MREIAFTLTGGEEPVVADVTEDSESRAAQSPTETGRFKQGESPSNAKYKLVIIIITNVKCLGGLLHYQRVSTS